LAIALHWASLGSTSRRIPYLRNRVYPEALAAQSRFASDKQARVTITTWTDILGTAHRTAQAHLAILIVINLDNSMLIFYAA
jgi:hypothetical protein